MSISSSKTTSSGYKLNGATVRHTQRIVNGKLGPSYTTTRNTVKGAGTKTTYITRTSNTPSKVSKNVPAKRSRKQSIPKSTSYKPFRSSTQKSTSNRSKSSSSGSDASGYVIELLVIFIVGIISAIGYGFYKMYRFLFKKDYVETLSLEEPETESEEIQ